MTQRSRENETIELSVGTGATEHVCGPFDFTHAALEKGLQKALKTATGELLKHYDMRTVDFWCQGQELRVGITVVDAKRPTLSARRLMDRGIETLVQTGKQSLRRFDGATVDLTRRGGLFVLQCPVVVPQLLAPVVDEPAGGAVDLPPIDEELERELMGREEVEPPVAVEVPAPGEPTSDERRHHRLTHLPYQGQGTKNSILFFVQEFYVNERKASKNGETVAQRQRVVRKTKTLHHLRSAMSSLPASHAFHTLASSTSHSLRSATSPPWMPSKIDDSVGSSPGR